VAGDGEQAQAVKVVACTHQTLIWERTRTILRLRSALREYFPAALTAYAELGLSGADTLELLVKAPTPQAAARLSRAQIRGALNRARRRGADAKAAHIQAALRTPHLGQSEVVASAYAATTMALAQLIQALNAQIAALEVRVKARASGKSTVVAARFVRNRRLADALHTQAMSALGGSPGVRAYYDRQRARGVGHNAALRQLGNRLVTPHATPRRLTSNGMGCLTRHRLGIVLRSQ
jgi:hypothetical protein